MREELQSPLDWEKLANIVNSNHGSQLLEIGFQMGEVGSRLIYYERALIQGVVFHENLFSIKLGWEALFDPFSSRWLWLKSPNSDGRPVQIIDHDVSKKQPVVEISGMKGLIKIVHYSFRGMLALDELDPSSLTKESRTIDEGVLYLSPNHLETGKWIIPGSQDKFLINQSVIQIP